MEWKFFEWQITQTRHPKSDADGGSDRQMDEHMAGWTEGVDSLLDLLFTTATQLKTL